MLPRFKDARSVYVVQLPLEQARMLAVDMRGLASDHCRLHHRALRLAQALGAELNHVVIKNSHRTEEVVGTLIFATPDGQKEVDVDVDAAASLAMTVHLGIPIYIGNFTSTEGLGLTQNVKPDVAPVVEQPQIPKAFRQLLEDLHMPDPEGGFPI